MAENRRNRYDERFNEEFLTDIDDDVDKIYYDDDDEDEEEEYDDSKGSVRAPKQNIKRAIVKEILSYIKILIIAAIIALIITKFVIINAQVPTGSMESTININDRLIGFRLSYLFSEPKRGDIIIFKYPDDESENYVKRVIGLPGDIVEIVSGKVYVNGEELKEDYIKEPMLDDGTHQSYLVPENHYFVLGDNRNNSKDSRYWSTTAYVDKDEILAKVVFKYYNGETEKITFTKMK